MARVAAIDLGTHRVKVAVWDSTSRGQWHLQGRYSAPVAQDGGGVPGLQARLSALDALLADEPAVARAGTQAYLAWGGDQASLHHMQLPFTDPAMITKTLPFAVESEVPFDLEQMALGWRIESQDEGSTVLVGMAKKAALGDTLSALADRGLDPHGAYVEGELLRSWGVDPEQTVAVLDIGHTRSSVVVVQDSRLVSARVLDVGGASFTRAIAGAMEIDWEQAQAIKHGQAVRMDRAIDGAEVPTDPGPSLRGYADLPIAARTAVDQAIGVLLAEVRSTLIAVEDSNSIEIDRVVVGGGGSAVGNLLDYLRQDLGVPVEVLVDTQGQRVPASWAVADAMAQRITGGFSGQDIDLRVGELAYRGGTNLLQALLVYGGAGLAFFSVAAVALFFWQSSALHSELDAINTEIDTIIARTLPGEKVRGTKKAFALMELKITEADQRAAALGEGGRPPLLDLLADLTKAFPPPANVTVDTTQLTLTPRSVSFDAETDSYASSDSVVESIQEFERFSQAAKSNDTKARDKIKFSVQIPLGDTVEAN